VIDLTMDEILEDLCYPGPPPGRWRLPSREPEPDDPLVAVAAAVVDDDGG
jgi:hypothetical protein